MSKKAEKEYLLEIRKRYFTLTKAEEQSILDEWREISSPTSYKKGN